MSATDLSLYALVLYMEDRQYLVPRIDDPNYITTVLDICRKEHINAITIFIDPKIVILAENRAVLETIGVVVLAPYKETAKICFDKYQMFQYLQKNGIQTVMTW